MRLWTLEEENLLKTVYGFTPKDELEILFPTKTVSQIWSKASQLKLKKTVSSLLKNGDISKLLEETPESYYWMGFILADGWFVAPGRIGLRLCEKDLNHLQKYACFLGCKTIHKKKSTSGFRPDKSQYEVSVNCNHYYKLIREKFDIKDRKTYNPPDISSVLKNKSEDLILSMFIGFCDGDGSIRTITEKAASLMITNHESWELVLIWFSKYIYNKSNNIQVSFPHKVSDGVILTLNKKSVLSYLKQTGIKLHLPVMTRKWDNIKE